MVEVLEKIQEKQESRLLREQPQNILAEQMLLGAILVNNEVVYRINDFLNHEHFYDPTHQKIYEAVLIFMDRGVIANPVTLKNYFDQDNILEGLGGGEYLAKLASLATTIINTADYARMIVDFAIRRKLIDIGEVVVNEAYEEDIKITATEQIERAEQELFLLDGYNQQGKGGFARITESISTAINLIQHAFKHKESLTGISTGLVDLDNMLGGLQNSDLLIIAGRPSMGKTGLGLNIAYNACKWLLGKHKKDTKKAKSKEEEPTLPSVGFFSLEMSSEQLANRMLAMETGISSSKLRTGQIDEDEFSRVIKASKEMGNSPFYIDDTPSLSIAALRTRARRLKRKHNVGLIVVDYLQLLKGSSKNSQESRVLEITEITQGLKAVAKELNIPVIALSQLSRAVEQREDKRPILSDLRESGSIEQDADIVLFIYREDYYLMRKQPREDTAEHTKWQSDMNEVMNLAELIIAKQRNGPVGNLRAHFDAATTKFTNHTDLN